MCLKQDKEGKQAECGIPCKVQVRFLLYERVNINNVCGRSPAGTLHWMRSQRQLYFLAFCCPLFDAGVLCVLIFHCCRMNPEPFMSKVNVLPLSYNQRPKTLLFEVCTHLCRKTDMGGRSLGPRVTETCEGPDVVLGSEPRSCYICY